MQRQRRRVIFDAHASNLDFCSKVPRGIEMRRLSRQYLYTAMYRKYCALSLCVCLLGSDWKSNTTHLFSSLRHTHDKILLRCRCSSLFCFVLVEFASLWLILLHCGCFCFNAGLFFPTFCVTAATCVSSTVDRATSSIVVYRDYYAGRMQQSSPNTDGNLPMVQFDFPKRYSRQDFASLRMLFSRLLRFG